jgi:hypothetical protein
MSPDIVTRCAAPRTAVCCVVVVADTTAVSDNFSALHPTDLEAARQGQISGDTL